jgi:hypothetical protein
MSATVTKTGNEDRVIQSPRSPQSLREAWVALAGVKVGRNGEHWPAETVNTGTAA